MDRACIFDVSKWLTPKTLYHGRKLFNLQELQSIWPIVMKHMIQYAMSTRLKGSELRHFLRRENYVPQHLPWDNVRFYWSQWCPEVELLWKELWKAAYPIEFQCQSCCWSYFQHDMKLCEFCCDKQYQRELPCASCGFHGKPNQFGILQCPEHFSSS
jgi:hypothetical protein